MEFPAGNMGNSSLDLAKALAADLVRFPGSGELT